MEAAQKFADAYTKYAQNGTFLAGVLVDLSAQQSILVGALAAGFELLTLQAAADAWTTGLTTFWTGAIVEGANPGTTVGCPGASIVSSQIASAFMNPLPQATASATLATILDAATRTVTAAVTIPGAPPVVTVAPIL
jgi:hypothetical protein